MENDNGQPESVVTSVSVEFTESLPVEFGWRVFRNTDCTSEDPGPLSYLERVTIYEGDRPLLRHHDILLIDIPDNMAVAVDVFERDRAIAGSVQKEPPIGFRKVLFSLGDTVEVMDFLMIRDSWHQDTPNQSRVAVIERSCGPGGSFEKILAAQPDHGTELVTAFAAGWLPVELGNHIGLPNDIKDRPLATGGKGFRGQADLVAQMVTQYCGINCGAHQHLVALRG